MLPPDVLRAAAAAPGGLLNLARLQQMGHNRERIAAWTRAGLLERLVPGLYRVADAPVPPTQCLHLPLRYLATPGRASPAALISGGAALGLLGVAPFGLPCQPLVLVDRSRTVRLGSAPFRVRRVALDAAGHDRHDGIDVAGAARVLADAALDPRVTDRELRLAVDQLRGRRLVAVAALVACWRRMPRHAGARRLLRLAPALEQESEAERDLYALFLRSPPVPDCQVVLRGRLRVDFVFLFAALIVEYLGAVHDGRADHDATRNYAFERLGYRSITVTKSMAREGPGLIEHIHTIRREREQLVLDGRLARPPLPPQPPRLAPLRTTVPLG